MGSHRGGHDPHWQLDIIYPACWGLLMSSQSGPLHLQYFHGPCSPDSQFFRLGFICVESSLVQCICGPRSQPECPGAQLGPGSTTLPSGQQFRCPLTELQPQGPTRAWDEPTATRRQAQGCGAKGHLCWPQSCIPHHHWPSSARTAVQPGTWE